MLSNKVKFLIALVVAVVVLTPLVVSLAGAKPVEISRSTEKRVVAPVTEAPAFVDDPAVIGSWNTVDFVRQIEYYEPGKQKWTGDLIALCNKDWAVVVDQAPPLDNPINWIVPAQATQAFAEVPPADGRRLFFQIRVDATGGGNGPEAKARLKDENCPADAGFMPPANHWVKFSYVPHGNANQGWRDNNCDGVKDIDGAPYGVGGGGPNVGTANRCERYADNVEGMTDEH